MTPEYQALQAEIAAFIDALADGEARDDSTRSDLLLRVLDYQRRHVAPYARLWSERSGHLPAAVPTDVFRFARVAGHAEDLDAVTFRTSGTTSGARGAHHLHDLSLYDLAAKHAARHALFPDRRRLRLVVLAPSAHDAPDSSLSYMLERFIDWFGHESSLHVWRDGQLDLAGLQQALSQAEELDQPVALLGTSFAFVHAEDALYKQGNHHYALPAGSRIMQTGGFKGRSRSVEPEQMLTALCTRYGVPEALVVQEYGMTELSSQLYETPLRQALLGEPIGPRRLWFPGWVQVRVVDPDDLRPLPSGATGLLRIEDLANLDSVCAIQTADLAVRDAHGLQVLGRAPDALARGCSLAVEEALGSQK